MFIINNLSTNEEGHLMFAGMDTVELATKHQTPLYLMDEEKIRAKCRMFRQAMEKYFDCGEILYASKAASFVRMYQIINEENLSADVVSGGELYTAVHAGFPTERIYFHGNNKSLPEIEFGIQNRVGYFIVDNLYELENVNLVGYHCHIGSQVFEHTLFSDSARVMLQFTEDIKMRLGFEPEVLNLGGGFGVRYVEQDPEPDIDSCLRMVASTVKAECANRGLKEPKILLEPGRSIVGDCGITLYTVGSMKEIPGYKKYVAVDGGMADNPRYALYQSKYTAVIANKANRDKDYTCTVAGKCCESGDVLLENAMIQTPEPGDILAVLSTGAYNYAMSSNYNRIPRPPIVMVSNQRDYVAVRRESFEDLVKNDLR